MALCRMTFKVRPSPLAVVMTTGDDVILDLLDDDADDATLGCCCCADNVTRLPLEEDGVMREKLLES